MSADVLLFGEDERGRDDGLRLQFEAVPRFDEEEKRVVPSLLEGMILKDEARRWQAVSTGGERKYPWPSISLINVSKPTPYSTGSPPAKLGAVHNLLEVIVGEALLPSPKPSSPWILNWP